MTGDTFEKFKKGQWTAVKRIEWLGSRTWFVPVSHFQGVENVEEFLNGNLEGFEQAHFQEDTVTRLHRTKNAQKLNERINKSSDAGQCAMPSSEGIASGGPGPQQVTGVRSATFLGACKARHNE